MLLRQPNNGPIVKGTADGQALVWNATLQEWFPGTPAAQGGLLHSVQSFTNGDGVTFSAGDTKDIIAQQSITLVGNAIRVSYKCVVDLTLGSGKGAELDVQFLVSGLAFDVFDTQAVADPTAGGASGDVFKQTLCATVWLTGLTPGATFPVKLQGVCGASVGQVTAVEGPNLILQIEDWTL